MSISFFTKGNVNITGEEKIIKFKSFLRNTILDVMINRGWEEVPEEL
jgi:hypothetical protein